MSIGIASIILIGNWVIYEYSFDRFHEKGDRIYRLIEKQSFDGQDEKYLSSMPEWLVETFEKDINGVLASTALFNVGNIWFGDKHNRIEVKNVTFTNNKIFEIFSIALIAGNPSEALTNPQSIVITESLAKRIFKDMDPVGQSIFYQNEKEYIITGVMEDIPDNSHFQTEMLVSIEERKPAWNQNDYNHTTSIYLLLKEGIDPATLWEPLQKSKEKYMPENAEYIELQIQSLYDIHLNSTHTMWGQNWKKSDSILVNSFLLIGILVLVISMINYINLTTASGFTRFKEAGLRKVIGSGKKDLIFQFLSESFLLIFISFWLSLLIIELVRPLLVRYDFIEFRFDFYQYPLFFPLSFLFILILSVLSGIYPAIVISAVQPVELFKRTLSYRKGSIPVRKILVIVQLTITCVLAISVMFITKQMVFMQHKELGYDRDAVVYFYTGNTYRQHYKTIKKNLIKYESIEDVTSSNIPLGKSMWRNCIHFEGESQTDQWVTPYMMVDYNFFDFYNIEVAIGRTFSENNALDKNQRAFLVNQSLAAEIGNDGIIGKRFRTCNSRWGEIVGVLKDFNYRSLHHSVEPLAIQLGLDDKNVVSVRIKNGHTGEALETLKRTWNTYQPDQPFRYTFLDESLNNLYEAETRTVKVVSLFSVISIIISCIGLLGLIMFVSESRTKEIGIRKVNGASLKNVIALLTGELMLNLIIALMIAIPFGWYVTNQWRSNFAYKAGISWWVFVISGGMVLFLAFLSVSFHTIKAARKNPSEVLRYE
jgi:putative ABC transport system permease protein